MSASITLPVVYLSASTDQDGRTKLGQELRYWSDTKPMVAVPPATEVICGGSLLEGYMPCQLGLIMLCYLGSVTAYHLKDNCISYFLIS